MQKPIAYIKPNESVFIAGRTGSGKTFLAKTYLANYPAVIALDTKEDLSWPEVPKDDLNIITRLADLPYAAGQPRCKVIYRPQLDEMKPEYWDEFFRYCYERKNCIAWIDEVMSICPTPYKIPEYYKGILTRGRSRNTACWSLSQRPSGIPIVIMSESKHFFIFDLNMAEDRERVAQVTGSPEIRIKPDQFAREQLKIRGEHYFWYYYITWDSAQLGIMAIKKGRRQAD